MFISHYLVNIQTYEMFEKITVYPGVDRMNSFVDRAILNTNEGSPKGSLMWLVQLNAIHTYTYDLTNIVLTRYFDSTIYNTIQALL